MKWLKFNNKISKKSIVLALVIILLFVGYVLLLNLINYKCIFHELFGIWCAGCGGTRMLISFVHLDFYQAFRWNPLMFILLIVGIIYVVIGIIIFIRKRMIIVPTFKVLLIIIGVLIFYMILRNIDIFSFLIPTRIS